MATPSKGEYFRFGPFELSAGTGELRRDGVAVRLEPQPFRLLSMLVSRAGELVSREEIRARLWSDGTTVEFDQSLNYCIRQIRAALNEKARESRYIETLPKRGYRMAASVETSQKDSPDFAPEEPSPQGIEAAQDARTESMVSLPGSSRAMSRWTALAISVGLGATLAFVVLSVWSGARRTHPDVPHAILVRPLINLDLPDGDTWFADALTQQLIGTLAENKTLRVVPWSSSLAIKGQSGVSLADLGRRFHVDAILEGSIRRADGRLGVSVQLVDVATERTLWSHEDQRDGRDLASVHDDILRSIAGILKLRLSETATPLARRRPEDLETYNLYLKASVLGDQLTGQGVKESIRDFEEVIRRAPEYAPAHAGLANSMAMLPFFTGGGARSFLARARETAERAIQLDPGLAAAHAALAHAYFNSWRWKESEDEFRVALGLDPDSAVTLQLYGLFLASQGRSGEAVKVATRAVELAPTSGLATFSLAQVMLHTGDFDGAIRECPRALELDPSFKECYNVLARAYTAKGMTSKALQIIDAWGREAPEPGVDLWKAHQLAASGHSDAARRIIDRWVKSNPRAANPPLALAAALVTTGQPERALDAIRLSIRQHVPSMVWVKSSPELASIRSDPRFTKAIVEMSSE